MNADRKWSGKGLETHFSAAYTNHENGQVWEMPDVVKMNRAYDAAAKWAEENGINIWLVLLEYQDHQFNPD